MERAVARASSLIEILARAPEPMRLTDLAKAADLQKSTVHRLLTTLTALGHARQTDSGRYAADLKTWEIGAQIAANLPIKKIAAGFLFSLHRTTGETVSLTLLSGSDVLYLEKIIAPRPVQFRSRVGSRIPAPLTASGKAILARRPDGADLARRAAAPLNLDIPALEAELSEVRARGYALSGYSPGVLSIGVAVAAGGAAPVAGLSVSAPADRLAVDDRLPVVDALLETAARMGEALDRT
ncbi:MAG: IclR family transcriptional regulator [Caulobacteraceae bacterium]|nr:IclR family transcriptional regulator [Caulobacteraceae bacterium]